MEMDVNTALQAVKDLKLVHQRLGVLKNLGLGYLTLGRKHRVFPAARHRD